MPGTVLVVDDDFDIRECISELLAAEGFDVHSASNGREGLDLLETAHPGVVVLDLMMPVVNGWEFLEEQKRRPDVARVPVVVVTASDSTPDVACILRKPIDIDELFEAVESLADAAGLR